MVWLAAELHGHRAGSENWLCDDGELGAPAPCGWTMSSLLMEIMLLQYLLGRGDYCHLVCSMPHVGWSNTWSAKLTGPYYVIHGENHRLNDWVSFAPSLVWFCCWVFVVVVLENGVQLCHFLVLLLSVLWNWTIRPWCVCRNLIFSTSFFQSFGCLADLVFMLVGLLMGVANEMGSEHGKHF